MFPGAQVSLLQGGDGILFSKFIKRIQNADNRMLSDLETGLILYAYHKIRIKFAAIALIYVFTVHASVSHCLIS